eukprot:46826-Rhodomonas_salina.1
MNSRVAVKDGTAIVHARKHIDIHNSLIQGADSCTGVLVSQASSCSILACAISGAKTGINIQQSGDCQVSSSNIRNCTDAAVQVQGKASVRLEE